MAKVIEGKLTAKGVTFGIVVSRFNDFINKRLLDGALDALNRHGAEDKNISIDLDPRKITMVALKDVLDAKVKYTRSDSI